MAFDPKCYELAEYFLWDTASDTDDCKNELAQVIQDAIEGWRSVEELNKLPNPDLAYDEWRDRQMVKQP